MGADCQRNRPAVAVVPSFLAYQMTTTAFLQAMVVVWRPGAKTGRPGRQMTTRPAKKKGQGCPRHGFSHVDTRKTLPRVVDFVTTTWYHVTTQKGGAAMNKNPKERTEFVQIRVTPAEKEQLKALAVAAGVSVTGYILGRALGDAIGQTILKGFDKS